MVVMCGHSKTYAVAVIDSVVQTELTSVFSFNGDSIWSAFLGPQYVPVNGRIMLEKLFRRLAFVPVPHLGDPAHHAKELLDAEPTSSASLYFAQLQPSLLCDSSSLI